MELKKGLVTKVFGLYYAVLCDGVYINCTLRGKLRTEHKDSAYTNLLAVGDYVMFTPDQNDGASIESIVPRQNVFSRKGKGRNRKEDIIAANLDAILVMQSCADPDFNPRFVDRLAVRGKKENIPVMLCINKSDLSVPELEEYIDSYYKGAPIDVFLVSARENIGIEKLKAALAGKTVIIAGYSGVGKTSILNKLFPESLRRTADVSSSTGKGKHTTTNVELVVGGNDSFIIDTPGIREFGLTDVTPEELSQYFYEFSDYAGGCGFSPCTHDHEPNCEIKRRVDSGDIDGGRYISYLNILDSLRHYYDTLYK